MNAHKNSLAGARVRVAAAVGGLACIGALATGAVLQQSQMSVADGGEMQLGTTQTSSTPLKAPAVPKAEPAIKGPAPLPVEEQGLPG